MMRRLFQAQRSILYGFIFVAVTILLILSTQPQLLNFLAPQLPVARDDPVFIAGALADPNIATKFSAYLASIYPKKEDTHILIKEFQLFHTLYEWYLKDIQREGRPGFTMSQQRILSQLQNRYLFPWLYTTTTTVTNAPLISQFNKIRILQQSFSRPNSRGIVITTGNKFFSIAVHAIRTIRMLGCTLPIEIYYMNNYDLSKDRRDFLQSSSFSYNITVIDITTIINIDSSLLLLSGWFIKPFAMLVSTFQEVIFIDADAVFMQNPSLLFESEQYHRTGTAFFYDRMIARKDSAKQYGEKIRALILPSSASTTSVSNKAAGATGSSSSATSNSLPGNLAHSRMATYQSEYEMDSGVIFYHKGRHFYALLLTCLMNSLPYRPYLQTFTMGDKETFWYSLEILKEPYAFVDHFAGTIGNPIYGNHSQDDVLCGSMAHFDDLLAPGPGIPAPGIGKGKVFWFQDSILLHKRDKNDLSMIDFTHVSHANSWGPEHEQKLCAAKGKEPLSKEELVTLAKIKALYQPMNNFSDYSTSEYYKSFRKKYLLRRIRAEKEFNHYD